MEYSVGPDKGSPGSGGKRTGDLERDRDACPPPGGIGRKPDSGFATGFAREAIHQRAAPTRMRAMLFGKIKPGERTLILWRPTCAD